MVGNVIAAAIFGSSTAIHALMKLTIKWLALVNIAPVNNTTSGGIARPSFEFATHWTAAHTPVILTVAAKVLTLLEFCMLNLSL